MPAHEIKVLIAYAHAQKPPLNVPAGIEDLILARVFNCIHTLCMRAAKALANLCVCAGSP